MIQTDELKSQNTADQGTKAALQDSFDAWVQVCDEMNAFLFKKSSQQEELKQYFERHKTMWEPTSRKPEAVAEMCWKLSQSNNRKGQHWEQNTLLTLAQKYGWDKRH